MALRQTQLALILVTGYLLAAGCREQEEQSLMPVQTPEPLDTQQPISNTDSNSDQPETPSNSSPQPAMEIKTGQQTIIQAVGRARTGQDHSLTREIASNRAIHKIADLLIKKGYSPNYPDRLHGVNIEKIWSKGRYTYAQATLLLSEFIEDN